MIEKILERFYNIDPQEMMTEEQRNVLNYCTEIVKEVAKEYDNGWIPVETELPKEHLWAGHAKSEDVFVTFLDNGGKARVDTDNTYDGKWHYYGDRVIAWMPKKLPAPYQKGE